MYKNFLYICMLTSALSTAQDNTPLTNISAEQFNNLVHFFSFFGTHVTSNTYINNESVHAINAHNQNPMLSYAIVLNNQDELHKTPHTQPYMLWLVNPNADDVIANLNNQWFIQKKTLKGLTLSLANPAIYDSPKLVLKQVTSTDTKVLHDFKTIYRDSAPLLNEETDRYLTNFDVKALANQDNVQLFVGYTRDNIPVTCGGICITDTYAGIYSVCTKSEYRKREYATLFTQKLLIKAKDKDASTALIYTMSDIVEQSCIKRGFESAGSIPVYIPYKTHLTILKYWLYQKISNFTSSLY